MSEMAEISQQLGSMGRANGYRRSPQISLSLGCHARSSDHYYRPFKGTYGSVEPFHLFRYLDEQALRFNSGKMNDAGRFLSVLHTIVGRRLTYRDLIGDAGLATTPA